MLLVYLLFLVVGFVGYIIGRWGDNYLNFWLGDPAWIPDHWIYGLIMMVLGIFLLQGYMELLVFSFGLGLLISDLKDFLHLKLYGKDNKNKSGVRFWHID